MFKNSGALLEGHFQLTSGMHSPNYFQCAKVLQYPDNLSEFAGALKRFFEFDKIDTVISPAIGGIVLGTEVGRQLGVKTIFAERKDGIMQLRRGFEIEKNEKVLVIEDVVTTGGSVEEVIDVVNSFGAVVFAVGFIVDRSNGKKQFNVEKQHSLFQMEVISYEPENCPLCGDGSIAIKPGSRGA
ncbi:MAG: orotate phosphoribosyltransferase [Calditrichaeota bacterium]|nr:orotate phosphoribosyltransferase [Calditrichota bacterium]